jgi:opacity protein-like surface antigen
MKKRLRHLLPLVLVAIVTPNLHAQAKFAIYGTAGGEKTDVNHESWTLAETFGAYYGIARLGPIALSIDGRGDLSRNMNSALFGPRAAVALPYFPIKPYVEVVGGVSNYNLQDNGSKNITDGTYRWVAGLDTTILPHIDWRIDYSYSGAGIDELGVTRHPQSLTSGIVIRF